jgi:hypothetical protein
MNFSNLVSSMSLTTALALLGAVVLVAVALHSWYTLHRLRPRQALDGSDAKPSRGSAGRVEPGLDAANSAAADGSRPERTPFGDTQPELPAAPPRPSLRLDALIDALAPLALDAPISGEMALAHMPGSRRAGSKPMLVEGLDADSGEWQPLLPGHRYSELQVGVQLVNRSGPINDIEYSEFVQKTQGYAEALGASADFPDMLEVVARARELDSLTSPLDAQLNVNLRSNGVAWSVAFVQQLAARQGFVVGSVPSRMVLAASEEAAPPVLVLTVDPQAALADNPQAAAIRECTLSLDVPQTAEGVEAYPLFHLTATALAAELDATPVDNAGRELSLQAYSAISHELTELYRQLHALDLPAGSAAARRLFS